MTDYKPGTVAKATVRGQEDVLIMLDDDEARLSTWLSAERVEGLRVHGHHLVTDVRPLILLDLKEHQRRFVVEILRTCADAEDLTDSHAARGLATSVAYRSVADQIEAQTKPPRIPEPDAIGSIVLAAQVGECDMSERYWTKFRKDGWVDAYDHIRSWDDLDNPTLVREGAES